jgi:hypothetical protein
MATLVSLTDSTDDNYAKPADVVDVGAKLAAQSQPFSYAYLRVTMTLNPSTNGAAAPILHDWLQRYSCEPAE